MYRPFDTSLDKIAYIAGLIIFFGSCALLAITHIFHINPGDYIAPCALNSLTKLYCPGCGGTRAVRCLLSGNIFKSLYYNPIVVYVFFPSMWFLITHTLYRLIPSIQSHKISKYIHPITVRPWYIYTGIGLLLIHCLFKNIMLICFKTALM